MRESPWYVMECEAVFLDVRDQFGGTFAIVAYYLWSARGFFGVPHRVVGVEVTCHHGICVRSVRLSPGVGFRPGWGIVDDFSCSVWEVNGG